MAANDFVLDTTCPRYRIWGTDSQERFYFEEWLPAFFERTIQITKRTGQGTLRWLFTGNRGRAEVRLENGEIELLQIYTDSYALYPKDQFDPDNMSLNRHPEQGAGGLYRGMRFLCGKENCGTGRRSGYGSDWLFRLYR